VAYIQFKRRDEGVTRSHDLDARLGMFQSFRNECHVAWSVRSMFFSVLLYLRWCVSQYLLV
jgi:hypothetical protein